MFDHLEPFKPCGPGTEFDPACAAGVCWAQRHKPSAEHLLQMAASRIGRAVGVTDVDNLIEINGRLLFVEHKGPGVEIKNGQKAALLELSACNPRITVLAHRPAVSKRQPLAGHTDNMVMRAGAATPWQRWSHGQFWDYYAAWLAAAKSSEPQRGRMGLA